MSIHSVKYPDSSRFSKGEDVKNLAKFLLPLLLFVAAVASADYKADKKKYDDCVTKTKKDYPVPPGNINEQKQMIKNDCGEAPKPPDQAKPPN
jgi:hypothetical protein